MLTDSDAPRFAIKVTRKAFDAVVRQHSEHDDAVVKYLAFVRAKVADKRICVEDLPFGLSGVMQEEFESFSKLSSCW